MYLYFKLNRLAATTGVIAPLHRCPEFEDVPLKVYHSATSTFRAPSDPSGITCLRQEIIRATPEWRRGGSRFDTVFINKSNGVPGFLGLEVARIRLFFSFTLNGSVHQCAAVRWYRRVDDEPDEDTGMWIVEPAYVRQGARGKKVPLFSVIALDTVVRAAHLVGAYVDLEVSEEMEKGQSLDTFKQFYVNKYIDHHAFELLYQ